MAVALYIRYKATDDGDRATGVTQPWWLSPDLVLAKSNGDRTDQIRAGQSYKVQLRVSNVSSTPFNSVHAQIWVCEWGTVPLPVKSWTLGPLPIGAPGPGQPPAVLDFETPAGDMWTVPGGQKHYCLLANCYAVGAGGSPLDGAPLADPKNINVPGNAHHAQHNLAYVTALVGRPVDVDRLLLWVGNKDTGRDREFILRAEPVLKLRPRVQLPPVFDRVLERVGARAGGQGLRNLLPSAVREPPAAIRGRIGALGDGIDAVGGRVPRPFPITGMHATPAVKAIDLRFDGQVGRRVRVGLAAGERSQVQLDVAFDDGELAGLNAFDVVQRDAATGRAVGGARLVVVRVPPDLF
jgi:hypothetical protein